MGRDPMKVCMVAGIFPPDIGGPATQAWQLCEVLQRNGVETFVVTFGKRSGLEEYHGIRVYRHRLRYPGGPVGKALRLLLFSARLARILRRERPQVVHCHDSYLPSLAAGFVSRRLGIPSIVKFAGDMVYEKVNARGMVAPTISEAHRLGLRSRALAAVERRGLRGFDVVWAASEFRRSNLVEELGLPPHKVRVIPNHIRLPSSDPVADDRNGAAGPFTILTAGRFARHKRLDRTLETVAALDVPGARLRLVGGGDADEERAVDDMIRRLGIGDRVERLGQVSYDELIRLMRSSHVLLSTSEEEGFGIVFVEAMATGLPVVALRIGAVPEVVPDGEAGFLVEPGDTAAVVQRLEQLARDPDLRQRMGAHGRDHAQRYDLETHWTVFADLYAELSQRRPAGVPSGVGSGGHG